MTQKKGKYFGLEVLPAHVRGSGGQLLCVPSPVAVRDSPAECHTANRVQGPMLALPQPCSPSLALLPAGRAETGCCLCCSSELAACRGLRGGGEQRGCR